MKILQLAARLPYPLTDGGAVGVFKIAEGLAKMGHGVTFVSYPLDDANETLKAVVVMSKFCDVHLTPKPLPSRNSTLLRTIFKGAYPVERRMMPEMYELLTNLLTKERFDIVHLDHSHMGKYGLWIKKTFGLPIVLRQHNFESLIYERYSKFAGNPVKKLIAGIHGGRLRKEEDRFLRGVDSIAAISEEDVALMRVLEPSDKYEVIPAGVDTEYFTPRGASQEMPNSILWVGGFDWDPNHDAVRFFCSSILPIIRRSIPDVKLGLVGAGRDKVRDLENEFVTAFGRVDDVRDYLARSAVLVVPLRIGGGMRLKLLDFFASGKAVVSTHVGAEGNIAKDEVELLLRDNPEEFAEAVVELLRDEALRQRLGEAARRLAVTEYSWSNVASKLTGLYEATMESSGRPLNLKSRRSVVSKVL